MGIQDRDYYRKKHQDAAVNNHRNTPEDPYQPLASGYRGKTNKDSGLRFLLYPTLVLAVLWFGADKFLQLQSTRNAPDPIQYETLNLPSLTGSQPANTADPEQPAAMNGESEPKGAIIKADAKGHFRGTVTINNVSMPFLIDTGATDTVIPAKLAIAAKLPFGRYVQSNTAGGRISVRETMIKDLRLGNAEVHNLKAQMNDHLNEVLIGMSTLRYFKMMQTGGTMTLIVNKQVTGGPSPQIHTVDSRSPANAEPQTSTGIKKTVTCDEHQVCTTKYSDR